MAITLGRNIAALSSERFLDRATSDLTKSFERLSSGMRINQASDDAAGLAIADSLRVDARVRNVALRNVNDAISMLSIVDSTLESQSRILTRLSELAESSANGTYSDVQRLALSREYRQLVAEFGRSGDSATFNNLKPLLSGRAGNATSINFQAGVNGSVTSILSMALKDYGSYSGTLNFDLMPASGVDIQAAANGSYTIDELATFYGGQMLATSITLGGKSYDLLVGCQQDDIVIGGGGENLQSVKLCVYARASDVNPALINSGPETQWQPLGGSALYANFSQSSGNIAEFAGGTITGHIAGSFNLKNLDLTGLKLTSPTRQFGLPNLASQFSTVIETSGVESAARARAALDLIKSKMDELSNYRGSIGAMQSRMHTASQLLLSSREQSLAAESRIRDVDVAEEGAKFVAAQIRQQASVAVLANVRSQQRLVLQLL